MKANEAPEKIYLCPSELAGIDYDDEWYDRPFGDSIEYTRIDVFMRNAVNWLVNNTDISSTGVKNFHKAMEGGNI